ncbi:hypothetical protein ACQP0C_01675 [Nocardia sp. CA-129566]|uniref:hypothetical protein n=1 Tax=Nocardia sp. CA-129566 TaxID=3239976 RepID=UPI003D97C4C5
MNDRFRRMLPGRAQLDANHFAEVQAILREASRADPETWGRVAAELRAQTVDGPPRLQAEIDGVIAHYWEMHPERLRGGENAMYGPTGPVAGPGPEEDDDAAKEHD